MKKIMIWILIVLISIILLSVIWMTVIPIVKRSISPLGKPESEIREMVLELTPIGMNIENVVKIIDSKERWRIHNRNYYSFPDDFKNIKSIKVEIGSYAESYFNFTAIYVYANYEFDDNSVLIDVYVEKVLIGL